MDGERFLILFITLVLATWLSAIISAITDLSWGKIKKLDPQKRRSLIRRAETLVQERDSYTLSLRLVHLTNLVVFAITVYTTLGAMLPGTNPPRLAIYTGLVTVVFVVATEVVGNGLIASHPWTLIRFSHVQVNVIYWILFPIVAPTRLLKEHFSTLHAPEDDEEKATTADEIISLVEQDAHDERNEGDLEDSERRMIRGIFDLDETLVKEIMTPRVDVDALSLDSDISAAKQLIVECGHSRIPVYKESIDHVVGIVYAKDLLNDIRIGRNGKLQHFLHEPVFVPETKNIGDLLDEFKQTKKQIAVIIDEYGGTAGLVTIEDILEEIVGEIRDEYDVDEVEELFTVEQDGCVTAEARTPIDEINELLSAHIPEDEDYDTVGGYITSELGRIPRTNEVLQLNDLEVLILEADERKVSRLHLKLLNTEEPETENGRNGH